MPWSVFWGTECWDMLTTGWNSRGLCQSDIPSDAGGITGRALRSRVQVQRALRSSVLWGSRNMRWQPALSCLMTSRAWGWSKVGEAPK